VEFGHSSEIWSDFPQLVAGVLAADGITPDVDVRLRVAALEEAAAARLGTDAESALPEIQAWRRAFAQMGLKPTQYRCASESLLRRFRKEGGLPRIHPLIDLCNAVSLAFATPVAVFDVARVVEYLEVRYAAGSELYETFSGETETPEPHEVIFADGAGHAHARRWTNRQSARSAVREETRAVLVVAAALHESARTDVERLVATLSRELDDVWSAAPGTRLLTAASPRFEV
jgi:DNA/RNA-binding domain of Phe-tRNA-synthetase-like protein